MEKQPQQVALYIKHPFLFFFFLIWAQKNRLIAFARREENIKGSEFRYFPPYIWKRHSGFLWRFPLKPVLVCAFI